MINDESVEQKRVDSTTRLALYEWAPVPSVAGGTHAHQQDNLSIEVDRLKGAMREVFQQLSEMRDAISRVPIRVRFVSIKDVPVTQAKDMIQDYYKDHDTAYPSDIADALAIPLKTTVMALEELKKEGKIRVQGE